MLRYLHCCKKLTSHFEDPDYQGGAINLFAQKGAFPSIEILDKQKSSYDRQNWQEKQGKKHLTNRCFRYDN